MTTFHLIYHNQEVNWKSDGIILSATRRNGQSVAPGNWKSFSRAPSVSCCKWACPERNQSSLSIKLTLRVQL